jgi:hypothetical protein
MSLFIEVSDGLLDIVDDVKLREHDTYTYSVKKSDTAKSTSNPKH